MRYVIGISAFYHDSSASLIKNGEIISAVQEERFTRVKNDNAFPFNSIKYLLEENNLTLNQIEAIVFYEKPFLKFERILETYIGFAPHGFKSFCASLPIWIREKLFQKKIIFNNLKKIDDNFNEINKIKFSEHHLSHIASAYYPSKFNEALILTVDGVGEWSTTTVSIAQGNNIEILKEINFPHSIGLLYSAFTYYLGFKVNSGEYKVMGLAPYGKPIFKNIIKEKLIDIKNDGSFRLNMEYFSFATDLVMVNKKFENLFKNKKRSYKNKNLSQFHFNVAASIQLVIEEIILKILNNIFNEYKIENLCLAGGVALNCVLNGKILENTKFNSLWVQPASGDAGGSLGAALAYWHIELKKPKSNIHDAMKGSLLGPNFKNNEIREQLIELGAIFNEYDDIQVIDIISEEIQNGKVIGWFQGKMEFGPRALGNRSILADPRDDKMQKNLNLKIKFRESFRPFAPSILKEKLFDFFKTKEISPYMSIVSEIKEEIRVKNSDDENEIFGLNKLNQKRSIIPAVTHVDYTSRIQTVDKDINEKFYNLINAFYKKTSVPILVNTSFNVRGEPIVNSPKDAFDCFMGTELDILVIENFILYKNKQKIIKQNDHKKKFKDD